MRTPVDAIVDALTLVPAVALLLFFLRVVRRRDLRLGIATRGKLRQRVRDAAVGLGVVLLAPTVGYSIGTAISASQQADNGLAALAALVAVAGVMAWWLLRRRA